jgi:HEPN domain-containing protein
VAEKAIKALHFGVLRKRIVVGHSLVKLGIPIGLSKQLAEECAVLDQYYIPTRYPNGLPDGSPFEVYTRAQAEEALATAEKILRHARSQLGESHD